MDDKIARIADEDGLFVDVSQLVTGARERVTRTVNTELTTLHWEIGARVRAEILGYERAEYGQRVVGRLAERLTAEFGRGWSRRNLFSMLEFASIFPEREIVQSLIAQLTWTHFLQLITINNPSEREFYTRMCVRQRWSVRALREQMRTSLYRRTLRGNPSDDELLARLAELPEGGPSTLESTFKDPYVLDFLGLPEEPSERELEQAILADVERFLLELGEEFCFVARQKRMRVGRTDYVLDLLFFHRGLRRLIAIELKTGALRPEHKGQMQLYLRWLDRNARAPHEDPPIGLILCTEKCPNLVELLGLDTDEIFVSTYLLERLPAAALQRRVEAIVGSRETDD